MATTSNVYWLGALSLLKAWAEFLETGCPLDSWDQLLEDYGEEQAAAKYRLDTQLILFRNDCGFYGVEPISLAWLEKHFSDPGVAEWGIDMCRRYLRAERMPVIPLEDLF